MRAHPVELFEEIDYLQPYPDRLLDDLVERETVELAFIAAIQLLPPKERAVLRDLLGWSAKEAAEALGDSVGAVTSALLRARASMEWPRPRAAAPAEQERALVKRFMAAWEPVLAAYALGGDGVHIPYGLMVLDVDRDRVAGIVGFPDPWLFERLELPIAVS